MHTVHDEVALVRLEFVDLDAEVGTIESAGRLLRELERVGVHDG